MVTIFIITFKLLWVLIWNLFHIKVDSKSFPTHGHLFNSVKKRRSYDRWKFDFCMLQCYIRIQTFCIRIFDSREHSRVQHQDISFWYLDICLQRQISIVISGYSFVISGYLAPVAKTHFKYQDISIWYQDISIKYQDMKLDIRIFCSWNKPRN